jgi:hypothetical protein
LRCPRCGNENPDTHRFCGMCGASLLQSPSATAIGTPPPGVRTPLATPSPKSAPAPATTRRAAPVSQETPTISGPSFLGLNQVPTPPRKRASLSIDPHASGPGDLDYLLEDEHPKHSGGGWKAVFIFVALVLAVGFGYLRFRTQGLDWLKQQLNKPTTQTSTTPSEAPPPASDTANPAAIAPAPTATAPASGPAIQPAPDPATAPAQTPAASTPSGTSTAALDSSAPASPSNSAAAPPSQPAASETPHPDSATTHKAPPAAKTAKKAEAPKDAAEDATDTDTEDAAPAKTDRAPARKPTAAAKPAASADPVGEAQRYLYGKGASQDCDRGMRLLKPAAEQSNPKAMIEMGALYSAGLCAPRDLPTAYRWFALALRKDPENEAVQTDLQKLWGEMTQPERQLAIRLTQ